nr:tetratricopeptide repeat protein [Lysinibacillus agricola]
MAAKQGNTAAAHKVGNMYFNGEDVKANYKKAMRWFKRAAIQGNDDAQYSLGYMLKNGVGEPVNYKKALSWFR